MKHVPWLSEKAFLAGVVVVAAFVALLSIPKTGMSAFQSPLPPPTTTPRPSPTGQLTPLPIGGYNRPPMGPTLWMTPPTAVVSATPTRQTTTTPRVANQTAGVSSSLTPTPRRSYLPLVGRGILSYGKKGIGDAWQMWGPTATPSSPLGTNIGALNYTWFYDWTYSYLPARGFDPKYVRMVWCTGLYQLDFQHVQRYVGDVARSDYDNGFVGRVWLIFNEPDATSQCNLPNASDAAGFYSNVYDIIKANDPSARVFAGGLIWLNTSYSRTWWTTFVNRLTSQGQLYKLEGVHVHLYPKQSTATTIGGTPYCPSGDYCIAELAQVANNWYQTMHVGLGLGDRPIWISETGWLEPSETCDPTPQHLDQIRDNVMQPFSKWFAGDPTWPYPQVGLNPGYDAIAWYVT